MPQPDPREYHDHWGARLVADPVGDAPNLEQMAREIGRRWGLRLRATLLAPGDSVGNWPGTLDEARTLVDGAVHQPMPHEDRELLAMLVERGARRAWHAQPEPQ